MSQRKSTLRQLFSDTMLYGLSSVVARLLNYLLTPLLTALLSVQYNGIIATIYALISFLNILFTFGIETSFFRYVGSYGLRRTAQSLGLVLGIIICFWLIILLFSHNWILTFLHIDKNPRLFYYALIIVSVDALATLGFAKLRYLRKLRYFVAIKMLGIITNISLVCLCLLALPLNWANYFSQLNFSQLDYVLFANLGASVLVLIALLPIYLRVLRAKKNWKICIEARLVKEFWPYAIPLLIIGLAGVINDTMDRVMLPYFTTGDANNKYLQNGIYAINYKLAALITLFIQAFRMGAEPIFFRYSKHKDAQELYADMLRYFVIFCLTGFLVVVLFLDFWQYFINAQRNSYFASGLKVVPILLFANIFFGIYYNLSVWYKVTDRTKWGAYLAIFGALITICGNIFFIPRIGYLACALSTLLCYFCMCVASYLLGHRYYPIPYNLRSIVGYMLLAIALFLLQGYLWGNLALTWHALYSPNLVVKTLFSLLFLLAFLLYAGYKEGLRIKAWRIRWRR